MANHRNLSLLQIDNYLKTFRKLTKNINSNFIDNYIREKLIEYNLIAEGDYPTNPIDVSKIEQSISNISKLNEIYSSLEAIIQTGVAYSTSILLEDIKIPGIDENFKDFFEMFAYLKNKDEQLFLPFKRYNDINYEGTFYSYDIKVLDGSIFSDIDKKNDIDTSKRIRINEIISSRLRQLSKTFSTKIPGVGEFSNKRVFIFRHYDVTMESYYFIVHYSTTKKNASLGEDSIINNTKFDSKNSFYFIVNLSNGFPRLLIKSPTHDSYLLAFIRSLNQVFKDDKIQIQLFSSEISNFSALSQPDTIQNLSTNKRINVKEMEFLYPERDSKIVLSSSSNNIFLVKDDKLLLSQSENLGVKRIKIQQLDSSLRKTESILEIRQDSIKIEEGGINRAIQLLKAMGLDDALSSEGFSFENLFYTRCAFSFGDWIRLPESAIKNYINIKEYIEDYRTLDVEVRYSSTDLNFSSDSFIYSLNGGKQTQGIISNHFQFCMRKNEMLRKILGKGFEEEKVEHKIKGIHAFNFLEKKKRYKVIFAENLHSLIEYDSHLIAENIVFLKDEITPSQSESLLKFFGLREKIVRFFTKESVNDFLINPSTFIKNNFEIGNAQDIITVGSLKTNKLNPDDLERMKFLLIDYNEYASGGKKSDIYGSLYHLEFEKNFWKVISCFYTKIYPLGAETSGGALPDSFMLGKDEEGDKIFILDAKSSSAKDPLTYITDEGEKLGRYIDDFTTPNTKSIVVIVGPKVSADKFENIHIGKGSQKGSQIWENMLKEGKRFVYIDSEIINFLKQVILSKKFHEAKGQIKQDDFFAIISSYAINKGITVVPLKEFKQQFIGCIRKFSSSDGKDTTYVDDAVLNEKISKKLP